MNEMKQKQNEVSLMDIIRLLLRKVQWLILVLIIGAGLGGAFGYFRTTDVKIYGTEIQFYINPSKDKGSSVNSDSQYGVYGAYGKNVLNNMVELLSSQAFAERLLLEDDGLPSEKRLTACNDTELNSLVETARVAVTEYQTVVEETENALFALNKANETYSQAVTDLDVLWSEALILNPSLSAKPQEDPNISNETLKQQINEGIKKVREANSACLRQQRTYDALYKESRTLEGKMEEKIEPALTRWRAKDPTYARDLRDIVNAVSYSYYDETADVEADDLARSFIYVSISVTENYDYAAYLRLLLIEEVPEYIEEKMPVPSGYNGTNCIRISRTDTVYRTNSDVAKSTAIKYGLLFGAAAAVIACIVIIFIDRSDKRLRSVEQITDLFDVPVLGVIPTFKNSQRADEESTEAKKETTSEEVQK